MIVLCASPRRYDTAAREREELLHSAGIAFSRPGALHERLAEVAGLAGAAGICTGAAFHVPSLCEHPICVCAPLTQALTREGPVPTGLDCRPRGELQHVFEALLAGEPPPSVRITAFGSWYAYSPAQPPDGAIARLTRLLGSLLFVPLRSGGETMGLLLATDARGEGFTPAPIACLETIAAISALAVMAESASVQLAAAEHEISLQRRFMPICAHCKKIRDDEGYWSDFETFMAHHFETSFSHGICPECLSKHYPQLRLRQS